VKTVSTWGPSKRKSQRLSGRSSGAMPRSSAGARAAGSAPRPADGSSSGRRAQATAELRGAVQGREHEFLGIGLIVVGALLALAIYFGVAGPVGRGVEELTGWFTGLARFAVPVALIVAGVALVRTGRSASPWRLAIGWGLVAAATLGLLHVINGPDGFSGLDQLEDGGGVVGAVAAEPLEALIATAGAVVILIGLLIGGIGLITQTSLRTMAVGTGRGVGAVAAPLGRAARNALRELSSLSSERDDDTTTDAAVLSDEPPGLPPPYDAAADFDDPAGAGAGRAGRELNAGAAGELNRAAPAASPGRWKLPPISLLHRTGALTVNRTEIEARGRVRQESLAQHGVETLLVGMTVGPTVTRYELELGAGVKVARVTALQRDIAYAMAATDVRILAPIPGRSAIGVEVPNHARQLVALGDILASTEATAATDPLDVALGKDIAGKAVFLELATTPHLLIAGATGAGKSSLLNCIITSIMMRSTPDEVRLILVDPKQVEMGQYNRLPHLLAQPVTNPKKAANALGWAVKEMERRYDLLYEFGFRDIAGYNAAFDRGDLAADAAASGSTARTHERLPFIVIVVDELNDLMMVAARDVEDSITRIAQKARAVGIHLIVATQRPSVNVITGVIKANIPARIAFAVSSLTDSRVILDQPGAEKLVGRGDMLVLPGNSSVAQRVQGAFVAEDELRKVVAHWRRQAPEVAYVSGVEGDDDGVTSSGNAFPGGGDDDDSAMLRQAMELVVRSQLGSTSMLQRKLKVGFARAGRLMDLLEQRGVVGPSEGSKARAVLMTVEEFELLQQAERDL
jgi:DNA segregation ATPase FtsK/SpoIIIE, S-DNA-T family